MKIRMLASFCGEWTCRRGDEVERPDKEAIRLIEAGFAEPLRAAPVETTMNKPAAEKARGTRLSAKSRKTS
jgi:hypothetical protein